MSETPSQDANPLTCENLSIEAGGAVLVRNLNLSLNRGDWLAVLGKNGSGKTLTLHTLCGLRKPAAGNVTLFGRPIHQANGSVDATHITLVTQQQDDAFASGVADNVLLGRYPHLGRWRRESESDRQLALDSLSKVALESFAARDITTLSGGERQRAAIAQALTQDTPLLLLDEPLSQLDPAHAQGVVELMSRRATDGYTLVSSLHDVNIACQYASHVLLLYGNGDWCCGPTNDMLTTDVLSGLYGVAMIELSARGQRVFVPDPITAAG